MTHAITRLSNHCSVQVYPHYILTSDSRAVEGLPVLGPTVDRQIYEISLSG